MLLASVEGSRRPLAWGNSRSALVGISLEGGEALPCGGALLRGLAEEKAEFLQALGEDVFARHDECGCRGGRWRGEERVSRVDDIQVSRREMLHYSRGR